MKERAKQILSLLFLLLLLPNLFILFLTEDSLLQGTASSDAIPVDEEAIVYELVGMIEEDTPKEAVKAQAVLIRTELKRQQEKNTASGDTLSDVPYTDIPVSRQRSVIALAEQAVSETAGVVLTYNDAYIDAAYHAVSSAATRNGIEVLGEEYEYLVSVDSKWDIPSSSYLNIKYMTPEDLLEKAGITEKDWTAEECVKKIKITERDDAGYVLSVSCSGKTFGGEWLRQAWGLSSSCFYLSVESDKIRILTKGVGHGLGLSQYGACKMAENGYTYEEILEYYFPKVMIEKE